MIGLEVNPWIPKINLSPVVKLRLFCFPYAGGSASVFQSWRRMFPQEIDICPVELPGHGGRLNEPLFKQLLPLVRATADGILPFLETPFAFFGHSMGALISFELARYLEQKYHLSPRWLLLSGRAAPQVKKVDAPIYKLPDLEFKKKIQELNGTPSEVLSHKELMDLLLPILRADFATCETYIYQPGPPLKCPITVFGGMQDKDVRVDDLKAWKEQTSGKFSLYLFPGDHFFIHTSQDLLLQKLSLILKHLLKQIG